jgi:uncharacterized membrane protein YidH (DUF202 family)
LTQACLPDERILFQSILNSSHPEVAMKTSILVKIVVVGLLFLVVIAVLPLILALFGNNSLSYWMNTHLAMNELWLFLFVSVGLMIYSVAKRGREKYLDEIYKKHKS